MFKRINLLLVLNIILLLIFIGPLIYLSNFIFLSTDDFCRANLDFDNISGDLREWYKYHNGRYVNALFSLMPVYDLTVYRIISAFLFLLLGSVLYWFIQKVYFCYDIKTNFHQKILITLLLYIVLIAQLPSLFEMFYWYAGISAYLFSFIFLLLFVGVVLQYVFTGKLIFLLYAGLIILINGNNELLILFINFILLLLLLYNFNKKRHLDKKLLFLNIISWLSGMALLLAPGTFARRELHVYGGDLFASVKVAFIYGAKFIGITLIEIPYLIFYIIIFIWVYHSKKGNQTRFFHPLPILLISYLSITCIFFTVYFATGLFDIYTGRIGNIVGMIVFIIGFLNIFNFAIYLSFKIDLRIFGNSNSAPILISFLLIFLIFKNENYVNLRKDFMEKNLGRYKCEMENRFLILRESSAKTIVLDPVKGTRILKSGDKYYIGQDWLQSCYTEYINSYLGKNFERIEIDVQQ